MKFDALKWKDEGSDREDEEGFYDKVSNQKNSCKEESDECFEDFQVESDEESNQ